MEDNREKRQGKTSSTEMRHDSRKAEPALAEQRMEVEQAIHKTDNRSRTYKEESKQ